MRNATREIFVDLLDKNRVEIELAAARWVYDEAPDLRGVRPFDETEALVHQMIEAYRDNLVNQSLDTFNSFIDQVVEYRGDMLFSISTPQRGFYSFRQILPSFLENAGLDIVERQEILIWTNETFQHVLFTLSDQYALKVSRKLQQLATDAEMANRAKSLFLANMSHELRTPLTAIIGLAELLSLGISGPVNEDQKGSLETIEASGRHLLDIVNDLLDIARIEADTLQLHLENVLATEICRDSLQMIQLEAEKKKHTINFHSESDQLALSADPRRLRQIILNLLNNACKFTPDEGQIDLITAREGDFITFEVKDTGIGMRGDQVQQIFAPFKQLDEGMARTHEGVGLGLALVRRLTEMHQGSIEVVSQPGQGTSIKFKLPAQGPSRPAE
jgi:signal transduction histidine kinase